MKTRNLAMAGWLAIFQPPKSNSSQALDASKGWGGNIEKPIPASSTTRKRQAVIHHKKKN